MVDSSQNQDSFADRLGQALSLRGKNERGRDRLIKTEIEKRGGKASVQAINKWANGETMPARKNMQALANWLGVRVEWLQYGIGPMLDAEPNMVREPTVECAATPRPAAKQPPVDQAEGGFVRFPLLEGFAGMGRGDYIGDYPEIVSWLDVTAEWASQKLPGIPHDAIRVITGRGQSMRGVFGDGDLIFVDSRVKEFVADDTYVFRRHGHVQIKRLQFVGPNTVRILSANPAYDSLDVSLTEIEIGGRAIAAWTLREV